ncbi:MAG: OmpA family protein [Spirosomataceae bacterium]|jgi:outer membrane protein OmpA-like peptidoglycan-associated protein
MQHSLLKFAFLTLVASMSLTGCKSSQKSSDTSTSTDANGKILSPVEQKVNGLLDQEMAALRTTLKNAEISRIDAKSIRVRLDPDVYFAWDSDKLSNLATENVQELALVLNKYPLSTIVVEGHADSTGTEKYNKTLSLNRAAQVINLLAVNNVSVKRMTAKWYGDKKPIASNATVEGRRRNRRIDAVITASKEQFKQFEAEQKNK